VFGSSAYTLRRGLRRLARFGRRGVTIPRYGDNGRSFTLPWSDVQDVVLTPVSLSVHPREGARLPDWFVNAERPPDTYAALAVMLDGARVDRERLASVVADHAGLALREEDEE
jgi:hypothetical protein